MFRDPVRAFEVVRTISARDPSSWERLVRSRSLEGIAPPRLVWANDDVDRPVLALVKQREIFEVDFLFDAGSSSYLPKRIIWARPPASTRGQSGKPPADVADAALQAFTDAVETYDVDGSKDGATQLIVDANAFAFERARQLFAGKTEALHDRARRELLKRRRAALPDAKSWRVVSRGDPPNTAPARSLTTLPLLKWEPARYFVTIRDTTRLAIQGRPAQRGTVLDALAPPPVVRTNDDLDNPTLAVIDRDEVFAVTLHYDSSVPDYVPIATKWLRRAAR